MTSTSSPFQNAVLNSLSASDLVLKERPIVNFTFRGRDTFLMLGVRKRLRSLESGNRTSFSAWSLPRLHRQECDERPALIGRVPLGPARLCFRAHIPHPKRELNEVVEHYDANLNLGLTDKEKSDLIEYLKSI